MITHDEYAGEKDLVHQFVKYMNNNSLNVLDEEMFLFIWGYEIWMPIGGRHGIAGIPDILATDTKGRVWLIEAKHSLNRELESNLWSLQIQGYRKALAQIPIEDIVMQSQRYLKNRSSNLSRPHFISDDCHSLLEAFKQWLQYLNIPSSEINAEDLYHETLQRIRMEDIINVVLADEFRKDVWESRPRNLFECAYIQCTGRDDEFSANIISDFKNPSPTNITKIMEIEESWSVMKKRLMLHPSPSVIRSSIRTDCYEMYDFLLNNLLNLGWNGVSFNPKSKSFVVKLPTTYGPSIRVMIGMVDYDSSTHSLKDKLAGEGGFKCDIDLTEFKSDPNYWNLGRTLALQLVEKADYKGRGKAEKLGVKELTIEQLSKWDGKLTHWKKNNDRDFTGRNGDFNDLKSMVSIIQEWLNKSPISPINSPNEEIVHEVKSITSGKLENEIFVFNGGNGKPIAINTSYIQLRPANRFYGYEHHLEVGDLLKLRTLFPRYFMPYDSSYTLESWGNMIKYDFYQLIKKNQFVIVWEDKQKSVRFKWIGPEILEPSLKFKKMRS